jgi:hypothetical protein
MAINSEIQEHLHCRVCMGSRLSEEPRFATTVQGVYCAYTLTATCFGLIGHPQAEHTIYKEVITPTTDLLYVV